MAKKLEYEQVENFQVRSSLAVSAYGKHLTRLDVFVTREQFVYEVVVDDITQFQGATLFQAVQEYNRLS